jgi:uncharacterized Ntn-hydrolase superfamily protein
MGESKRRTLALGEGGVTRRPLHTFSIVARDAHTGELGVAVQSHWFSVGSVVSWAAAGVGAIATQSFINVSFGPRGLDLLRAGLSAPQVVSALIASDEAPHMRQLAVVDVHGRVAAHTGERCIAAAGHIVGEGFSVQANMMLNERVWPAMAGAFRTAAGPLAERLVAALKAGQEAGGDIRGQQSAALLVVRGQPSGRPWEDRLVDLRVDDAPEPIRELERLLRAQRAYERMNEGDAAMERDDVPAALAAYSAAEAMCPENLEMRYWHAVALANTGRMDEALPVFAAVFAGDDNWRELTRRLPPAGLLRVGAGDLERILSVRL